MKHLNVSASNDALDNNFPKSRPKCFADGQLLFSEQSDQKSDKPALLHTLLSMPTNIAKTESSKLAFSMH
jgi:hypothetical protein